MDAEDSSLLQFIEAHDPKLLTKEKIEELGKLLVLSDIPIIRNTIAAKFRENKNPLCLPYLVEGIKRNLNTKYVAQLVSACEAFNCGDYLHLFVDIIILKSDITLYHALTVIRECISAVNNETEALYAIQRLELFLTTVASYYPFEKEVNEAVEKINIFV